MNKCKCGKRLVACARCGVLFHRGIMKCEVQTTAEQVTREQIAKLKDKHVTNAALVALDAHTGEILAMLGSVDFYNKEIDGQVNIALRPRQPGSSIKPLAYVTAFQKGWTPSTLIWDVPTTFTNTYGQTYSPKNYDGLFHGPVSVRSALANSYNIPAVKALDYVGLPAFLDNARLLGLTTLTRQDYWLALTLGGGEVPLIEMAGMYQTFANGGKRMPPVAIAKVTNAQGRAICQFTPPGQDSKGIKPCQVFADTGKQVIAPEHARDKEKVLQLKRAGWMVLTIWECQLEKNLQQSVIRVKQLLSIKRTGNK